MFSISAGTVIFIMVVLSIGIGTIIYLVSKWVRSVNSDRKKFDEFMREITEEIKEINSNAA